VDFFSNPSAIYTKWCAETFPPIFGLFAIFDRKVDVHLYKFFSARRYIALIAIVKLRTGNPKTARNEQLCAHQ